MASSTFSTEYDSRAQFANARGSEERQRALFERQSATTKLLTVPNVGKIDIIGAQDEVIYLEISTRKTAALGIDQQTVIDTLQAQNAVAQSGIVEAGPERIALRVGASSSPRKVSDPSI